MLANPAFRRAVGFVALANLAYFGVEFAVAFHIQSVSLFADSIDFLEDASVNCLIFFAVTWAAAMRARVGTVLAGLLLVPGLATLWTVAAKVAAPMPPDPVALSLTGVGALMVNVACAFMLARYRRTAGSLTKAAFLSARNDAVANVAIIAAGFGTLFLQSAWPDLIVGLAIAAMNADAARQVWQAAKQEQRDAKASS
jgi:Co/Zn/Cd efflux system component